MSPTAAERAAARLNRPQAVDIEADEPAASSPARTASLPTTHGKESSGPVGPIGASGPVGAHPEAPSTPADSEQPDDKVRLADRSFRLDDAVYLRFRAAVLSTAHMDDPAASLSMNHAVERLLEDHAQFLEQRFNGGRTFDAPPMARRRPPRRTRS